MTRLLPGIAALLLGVVLGAAQSPPGPARIFVFHADEMWLNLHHFLYVLGRHEAATPDRTRRAVVAAPADAEKGLAALSPAERQAWRDTVSLYAKGASRQDLVFDDPAIDAVAALVRAGSAPGLESARLDSHLAAALERAAPIYRKAWWPAHQSANREWVADVQKTVAEHGRHVLDYITRAYQLEWPSSGYPVHVSGYANWAGAYSTRENILVVSSLDPAVVALDRLESVFHEAMHQWDEPVQEALRARARAQNARVPPNLSHALLFYTAGEAVRAVSPSYVPYGEAQEIWQRGLGVFKADLDAVWKPYLDGKGTREKAFTELIKRGNARAGR